MEIDELIFRPAAASLTACPVLQMAREKVRLASGELAQLSVGACTGKVSPDSTAEDEMAKLVDAGNTGASCLRMLEEKGYVLSCDVGDYVDDDESLTFAATRDGTTLFSSDPTTLAGLAALHEFKSPHGDEPYWWRLSGSDLHDRLLSEGLDSSFIDFKEERPDDWAALVKRETEKWRSDPSILLSDRLGVSVGVLRSLGVLDGLDPDK